MTLPSGSGPAPERRPDPAPPACDAVVFDLFHTLVDPEEFRPRSFLRGRYLADRLRLDPGPFLRFWQESLPGRTIARRPSVRERILAYAQGVGATLDPAELDAALLGAEQYQDRALERPHADVLAALTELRSRGVRIGLLSNCDELEVRAWGRSPLARLVDFGGFSCDLGVAKPDVAAYRAVLEGLGGIAPARASFVGDGTRGELVGARATGFGRVVLLRHFVARNGLRTESELAALARDADASVDSFADLLPVLLGPGEGR